MNLISATMVGGTNSGWESWTYPTATVGNSNNVPTSNAAWNGNGMASGGGEVGGMWSHTPSDNLLPLLAQLAAALSQLPGDMPLSQLGIGAGALGNKPANAATGGGDAAKADAKAGTTEKKPAAAAAATDKKPDAAAAATADKKPATTTKPKTSTASKPKTSTADKPATKTYTVKSGDTLSEIAQKMGVDGGWKALYAANKSVVGGNPNLIRPGQKLKIPA